jgi:ferredoxin
MGILEQKIKDFVKDQGVKVFGIAGSERLDGPPSLDLDYSMKGAQSVISIALPMDVSAIDDFLSKQSPAPHNLDQFINYQRLFRIEIQIADYLKSLGCKARALPTSADYRRSPYVFSLQPAFSMRFAAIASGIAGQGLSGNVITKEYGAAVYLGAVVTDAKLASDPSMPPDYFYESRCTKCRRCAQSCPSKMFSGHDKEQYLLNGQLYTRGKRHSVDLCKISCFGLHSLSHDRKWTNWGLHWINDWVEKEPNSKKKTALLATMLRRGLTTGDSMPRFDILKRLCTRLYQEEVNRFLPSLEKFPRDESERYGILAAFIRSLGVKGIDSYPIPMICGQCALVCGPTLEETFRRHRLLVSSGLVVPGEEGRMTRVDTFEEASLLRGRYPLKSPMHRNLRDTFDSIYLWHRYYFGLGLDSHLQAARYRRRMKKFFDHGTDNKIDSSHHSSK